MRKSCADSRAGARAILASIAKRRFENRSEGQRLRKMLRFETLLWEKGHDAVAGIDEAGMSSLAGSLIVLQASLEIRNERVAQMSTVREELTDMRPPRQFIQGLQASCSVGGHRKFLKRLIQRRKYSY